MKTLFAHVRPVLLALSSACAFASTANAAVSYTGLNFSNWINEGGATLAFGGNTYKKNLTMKFTNVANVNGVAIDATITASAVTGSGDWGGWSGNYNGGPSEPRGDIALLYYGDAGTSYFTYSLQFFVGGSSFTQRQALESFRLMMYDVDGEAAQDEFATAYKADGLVGYSRGPLMKATESADSVRFEGPGANQNETDTAGAFFLYYANTDTVNIRMENFTTGGANNPVFSALDGDASLLPFMTGEFTPVSPVVPAPGAVALLGLAGLARGRRQRA